MSQIPVNGGNKVIKRIEAINFVTDFFNEKRNNFSKLAVIFFMLLLVMGLTSSVYAKSLEQASNEVAKHFKTLLKGERDQQLVFNVSNYLSKIHDREARSIETELYFALENILPNVQLLIASEAIAGIPSGAIMVSVTYELKGNQILLRIQAVKDRVSGEVLTQTKVLFELPKKRSSSLVAVLDLEGEALQKAQRRAYSDIFRSAIHQYQVFDLVSSAELDKMDINAVKSASGCRGDECGMIIGEQLGVDRLISINYFKIEEGFYFITANLNDLKDGSLTLSQTVEHNGDLSTLKKALEELAFKMVGEPKNRNLLQVTAAGLVTTGKLFVTSSPSAAEIFLDGEPLNRTTDLLLQKIEAGKHVLTLRKNGILVSKSFVVKTNQLTRVNVLFKRERGGGNRGKGRGRQSVSPGGENAKSKGGKDAKSNGGGNRSGGGNRGGGGRR